MQAACLPDLDRRRLTMNWNPQGPHPRRPPALLPVCLHQDRTSKGSTRVDTQSTPERRAAAAAAEGQTRPPAASPARRVSDESGHAGASSVQNWFDRSNKRPTMTLRHTLIDNDPPFFLRQHNSSSSSNALSESSRQLDDHPPDHRHRHGQGQTGPVPAVLGSATNGSSAGDFRSVIDDLTIENRKLKERLRRYQAAQNVHLEKEKLFEVKVHGLSAKQKRELEDTLRCFAASIDGSPEPTGSKLPSRSLCKQALVAASKNTSLSSMSNSGAVDSAYASMPQSGPISTATLNRVGADRGVNHQTAKEQKVQTFLHNIPEGLLPKHTLAMTERQKMKMVVRRLEQLFTGARGAVVGEHSQPLQQQEVSKSAAMAELAAHDKPSAMEGIREAHILPYEMEVDLQRPLKVAYDSSHETDASRGLSDSTADGSLDASSPEQRPTRPLDLDPDRVQIPSDNVEYLRHLGLSATQRTPEDSDDVAADADGWVYLNLLVNMAQLHIINVTPDFVCSAVADMSEKFQLSRDGRKVRWTGGTEGTQLSSDSGNNSSPDTSPLSIASRDESGRKGLKRRKIDVGRFAAVPIDVSHEDPSSGSTHPNLSHYTPLFHHGSYLSEELTSMAESDSAPDYSNDHFDWREGGRVSQAPRLHSRVPRSMHENLRGDDGPIVFYSGAQFCTDLSCDRGNINIPFHDTAVGNDGYSNHTRDALGCTLRDGAPRISRTDSGSFLPLRPFKDYSTGTDSVSNRQYRTNPPELMNSDEVNQLDNHLEWASRKSLPATPVDFLASGLGGTQPADHFAIKVETRRTILKHKAQMKLSKFSAPGPSSRKFLHTIPTSFLETFQKRLGERSTPELVVLPAPHSPKVPPAEGWPVQTEIISAKFFRLEPSELPPPLGHYATLSSSDDDSDFSSYSSSFSDNSYMRMGKPLMPRPQKPPFRYVAPLPQKQDFMEREQDSCIMEDGEDEASDESIDMLAPARKADPKTIAEREEEFERQAGQRLVEELPTESSAATVGGGSGYLSTGGESSGDMDFD